MNIEPIIRKKIQDLRDVGASVRNEATVNQDCAEAPAVFSFAQ
jgi:hypothetical protein